MTDKPPYTLPPSLQDAMKLIGFDQGREASYSFVSIDAGDKVEWLDVPHKQIDFVQFRTEFLDGIAKQFGIPYEVLEDDYVRTEALALLQGRRDRLMPQIVNLLAKPDPRRTKRAWRLWRSTWGRYCPSAAFYSMVDRERHRKFAIQMQAAVTNAAFAAYIKDIK